MTLSAVCLKSRERYARKGWFSAMEITELQMDVLREIGNIGVGHAATALSGLLMRRIEMSVPKVWFIPFKEAAAIIGQREDFQATIYVRVLGEAPGKTFFFFPIESAKTVAQELLHSEEDIAFHMDEMAQSVMKEIGNVMVSSFLMALTQFSGILFRPSVPALAVDMVGAIIDGILLEEAILNNSVLFIDTQISGTPKIEGQFLFLPGEGTLEKLFGALGI